MRAISSGLIMRGEAGHAGTLPAMLVAAAGAVLLGIGAAGDDLGWLAIAGGIVLAVGILGSFAMNHMIVEYGIFERLDKLEEK